MHFHAIRLGFYVAYDHDEMNFEGIKGANSSRH